MPDRRRPSSPPLWGAEMPDPVPRPLECDTEEQFRRQYDARVGVIEEQDILAAQVWKDAAGRWPENVGPLHPVAGSDDGRGGQIMLRLDRLFASRSTRARDTIEARQA
jgi:hypothetical protein